MEKISKDLEVAKLKKEGVKKACEQVNAEASAMVLLCLQWEDLERHFDGIQRALEVSLEKNVERERCLDERSRRVDEKERRLCVLQEEIGRKEEELAILEKRVKECNDMYARKGTQLVGSGDTLEECLGFSKDKERENSVGIECCEDYDQKKSKVDAMSNRVAEVERKVMLEEKRISMLQQLVEERPMVLNLKNKEMGSVQGCIKQSVKELKEKKDQLSSVEKLLFKWTRGLNSTESLLEERLKELHRKPEELTLIQRSIDDCCGDLDWRKEGLGVMGNTLEDWSKGVDSKKDVFTSLENYIKEFLKQFDSEWQEFEFVQTKLLERSKELQSQEGLIRAGFDITLYKEELIQIEKSATERCDEVGRKLGELRSFKPYEQIQGKVEELDRIKRSFVGYAREIGVKVGHLGSIKLLIEEHSQKLDDKERQYHVIEGLIREQLTALDLKKRGFVNLKSSITEVSGMIEKGESRSKRAAELLQLLQKKTDTKKVELTAFKLSLKELCEYLALKKDELNSVHLNIDKYIVKLEQLHVFSKQKHVVSKQKLNVLDDFASPSKRARSDNAVLLDRGHESPNGNSVIVYDQVGIVRCPDSEFGDFDKLRSHFAANQFWACYDNDGMPRIYARIKKVLSPGFKLQISWLEAVPTSQSELDWSHKDLPVACGYYRIGGTEEAEDPLVFSHQIYRVKSQRERLAYYTVYPAKGEIWAIFKNWDIKWSSDPQKHLPYRYEYVEIVSDFKEESGVKVAYLRKVKGFVSVFQRVNAGNAGEDTDAFRQIHPDERYRFSHQIPAFKMTGKERAGVPAGSFELDPAGLNPDELQRSPEKESTQMRFHGAKHQTTVKLAAGNKTDNSGETSGLGKRKVVTGSASQSFLRKSNTESERTRSDQYQGSEAGVAGMFTCPGQGLLEWGSHNSWKVFNTSSSCNTRFSE